MPADKAKERANERDDRERKRQGTLKRTERYTDRRDAQRVRTATTPIPARYTARHEKGHTTQRDGAKYEWG